MQADLAEDDRLSLCGVNPNNYQYGLVRSLLKKYVASLKENIDSRFQKALPLVSSFSVFDPLLVPPTDDASFKVYGSSEIDVLAAHYFPTQTEKEKLQAEWNNFKFELAEWKSKVEFKAAIATTTTPTEWALNCLITMKQTYSQVYPMLFKVTEVCMTMPVSNAWPERSKRIKKGEDTTKKPDEKRSS